MVNLGTHGLGRGTFCRMSFLAPRGGLPSCASVLVMSAHSPTIVPYLNIPPPAGKKYGMMLVDLAGFREARKVLHLASFSRAVHVPSVFLNGRDKV